MPTEHMDYVSFLHDTTVEFLNEAPRPTAEQIYIQWDYQLAAEASLQQPDDMGAY